MKNRQVLCHVATESLAERAPLSLGREEEATEPRPMLYVMKSRQVLCHVNVATKSLAEGGEGRRRKKEAGPFPCCA